MRPADRLPPLAVAAALLAACASSPQAPAPSGGGVAGQVDGAPMRVALDLAAIPDAVPRAEARAARGNPPFYRVDGQRYFVMDSAAGHVERGIASWYGTKFHGRATSSGEPYDMFAMTAAHRTLPLPSYVEVTNLENGRAVVLRVNDRGPFAHNRVIDLSYAAAVRLDIVGHGTGLVELRVIDPPGPAPGEPATAATPRLFVQVGAFSDRGNAERVAAHLREAGVHDVVVSPRPEPAPALWRVRAGPLADVGVVDAVSQRIAGAGYPDARVIIE